MPMFQRRHYDAIAACIRPLIMADQRDMFDLDQHREFIKRLSDAFAKDNPNFRRERFERAAGVTD